MKLQRILTLVAFSLAVLPISAQELPAVPLTSQIEAPKPKPDRRIYWAGVSLLAASATVDGFSTERALSIGRPESNPFYGKYPSVARLSLVNAGLFASQIGVFYLTEHSRHRWIRWTARAYVSASIVNHAHLAACNYSVSRESPTCQTYF